MKDLNTFKGLKVCEELVDVKKFEQELQATLFDAQSVIKNVLENQRSLIGSEVSSAIISVNAFMESSQPKCTLVHPPEPIESVLDSSGNIVLRCFHSPCHEWDLSGERKK